MKVIINDLIGSRCILKDDGQKLFNEIIPFLEKGDDVFLDFSGVYLFASPFFNFSIGQLISFISEETLRNKLHIENLDIIGRNVMERVIENAARFHQDKDYKKIVDQILEQQAKESD